MSIRYPKLQSKTKLPDLPSKSLLLISVNGNTLLPVPQAKTFTLFLSYPPSSFSPHAVSSSFTLYLDFEYLLPRSRMPHCSLQSVLNAAEGSDLYPLDQIVTLLCQKDLQLSITLPVKATALTAAYKAWCNLLPQVFVQRLPSPRGLLRWLYLKLNLHPRHLPTMFSPEHVTHSDTVFLIHFLSVSVLG